MRLEETGSSVMEMNESMIVIDILYDTAIRQITTPLQIISGLNKSRGWKREPTTMHTLQTVNLAACIIVPTSPRGYY